MPSFPFNELSNMISSHMNNKKCSTSSNSIAEEGSSCNIQLLVKSEVWMWRGRSWLRHWCYSLTWFRLRLLIAKNPFTRPHLRKIDVWFEADLQKPKNFQAFLGSKLSCDRAVLLVRSDESGPSWNTFPLHTFQMGFFGLYFTCFQEEQVLVNITYNCFIPL